MVEPVKRRQVDATHAVVRWYLGLYHGTPHDLGGPATFLDPLRVGAFAVSRAAFERGEPRGLFKLLIAMTLFQRRQDQQVLRILRGMSPADVRQVADVRSLDDARVRTRCEMLCSSRTLHELCDLSKTPGEPLGRCGVHPRTPCHLKRHTVLLKRYGHFGKVPTSAALMLAEIGVRDLRALRLRALSETSDPAARAEILEAALMRVWRVNRKISAMFLSAVCNPDLGSPRAPWCDGIDSTRFVVIDSNTDLFLSSVGYAGAGTYDARLAFICALSRRIDLSSLRSGLRVFNPRLVQQAMYMFMSRSNRRSADIDCSRRAAACAECPSVLASRCLMSDGRRRNKRN